MSFYNHVKFKDLSILAFKTKWIRPTSIYMHNILYLSKSAKPRGKCLQSKASSLRSGKHYSITCLCWGEHFDRTFEYLTLTHPQAHTNATLFTPSVNLSNDLFVYFAFNISNTQIAFASLLFALILFYGIAASILLRSLL